ncbi:MAG: purine-nucleoside phosphorylase [Kiritimatiellia bacterium]
MDMAFFERAAAALPDACFETAPDLAVVLGSGWGHALQMDREVVRMSYRDIPGYGAATVSGHAGEFVLYERAGRRIAAFCGRRHWYEGIGWEAVVLPIELVRRMGCRRVLLTNAAGGLNPALHPGDFVILGDHVNTVGANPLIGPHVAAWGARFPDMTETYSKAFRSVLHAVAAKRGLRIMEGVYAFTSGPVYETPAEIRAYGHMGADVVGMSTVPEAIFAHACGLEVAGLSLVTNLAAGISPVPLCHAEVLEATRRAQTMMQGLLEDVIGFCYNSGPVA